jgi:molybdenum cofactor cytidylyltransferase
MGRPKLLLEINGRTVIRGLVDALLKGGVSAVYILVRQSDAALQAELGGTGAHVVRTADTPDMRASVAVLLDVVHQEQSPGPNDGWLLAPADHPLLQSAVIAELLTARHPGASEILVPSHEGRRGHPTYFSWDFAAKVASLPDGQGVNQLLKDFAGAARQIPVATPNILVDLDTPADLARLRNSGS